jgi:hypothetical protein
MRAVQWAPKAILRAILLLCGLFRASFGLAPEAAGQIPDSLQLADTLLAPADTLEARVDEASVGAVSGRGAFIRSALIPGWGHAKVGAFTRGAFYFSAQSSVAFMALKTQSRIKRTDERIKVRETAIRSRLVAEGIDDLAAIEAALEEDEIVADLRLLRESRAEQREDWLALGIFLMLIGGADAYVSSHLTDIPTAVVIEPTPDGGVEVGLSLLVGF